MQIVVEQPTIPILHIELKLLIDPKLNLHLTELIMNKQLPNISNNNIHQTIIAHITLLIELDGMDTFFPFSLQLIPKNPNHPAITR